ncbi:hypothetical protein HDU67_004601 [Dinochytrium kinnereticum]|nr:hypothetical protein HDU67_004601 [Dinochytrium kinnereticum]
MKGARRLGGQILATTLQKRMAEVQGQKKSPSDFLNYGESAVDKLGVLMLAVIGRSVVVKLNSGVDYRGTLACLDGYMNIALEQTEEYVNGQLKHKYGDCFIRGNNGAYCYSISSLMHDFLLPVQLSEPKKQKFVRKMNIKEVWASTLETEMAFLRDLVEKYPYISMDTEFPGVVARPIGNFRTSADYHYQTLRCNVDLLKIIQLGLTFADENGNSPPNACTWQFNFKFNLSDDMYAQDSIDLLTKSGIDFKKHEEHGIDVEHFGELLTSSGFVLVDEVKWISFHSYFPAIYDIKYLMKSCKNLKGGLQDVADDLQVSLFKLSPPYIQIPRIGPQHQAGSDSLLTCKTFFKMRQTFFDDKIEDEKYLGYLYGL